MMSEFLDVSRLNAIDAAVRLTALALPLAALATLLFVQVAGSRARKKSTARLGPAEAPAATPSHDSGSERDNAPPQAVAFVGTTQTQTADVDTAVRVARLSADIERMTLEGRQVALAPLFLQLAHVHQSGGDQKGYHSALRSAAGVGAKHGPASIHAQARLELAEAALAAGDPIGACEQWQMARTALQSDGQTAAQARVDQRMRDNGCPTDWVLTDF